MRRLGLAASIVVVLAATASVGAEELNLAATSTARPSIIVVRAGVDHAFVGEVGYRHVLAFDDQQLFLGGDVAMPWASPDFGDYRVRATVGLPLGGRHWKLAGWLSPTLRGTDNAESRMTSLGADLRVTGGYYARGWFIAGELGLDWVAATQITFSDAYRTRVYSGARDGWYSLPGGTAYTGLQGGLSFSSFDLVVRAGLPRTTALAPQSVPAYLTLGVNMALPR